MYGKLFLLVKQTISEKLSLTSRSMSILKKTSAIRNVKVRLMISTHGTHWLVAY